MIYPMKDRSLYGPMSTAVWRLIYGWWIGGDGDRSTHIHNHINIQSIPSLT